MCVILCSTKGDDNMNMHEDARIFKALGDENRLQILILLQSEELCACHLLEQLNITQPTLSHHMKLLCDSGIVNYRKDGKWMHYSIADDCKEKITAVIAEYLNCKG